MASLQERGGTFRVIFRYLGKQHFVRLGKVSRQEAESKAGQVDYLLMRLDQRLIEPPPGTDIADFVKLDGKAPARASGVAKTVAKNTSIGVLRDRYLATHANAHEGATLRTARIHFKHLISTLGEQYPLPELQTPTSSATSRSGGAGRGFRRSPSIRKSTAVAPHGTGERPPDCLKATGRAKR